MATDNGLQEISTAIITDFNTNIATPNTLEFRVENDARANPTDSAWAKVQVRDADFNKQSYNDVMFVETGFFTVQLFQELGKGTKFVNDLAKSIRDRYNDFWLNGYIFFEKADIVTIGRTSNNDGVFQINIVCTYVAEINES